MNILYLLSTSLMPYITKLEFKDLFNQLDADIYKALTDDKTDTTTVIRIEVVSALSSEQLAKITGLMTANSELKYALNLNETKLTLDILWLLTPVKELITTLTFSYFLSHEEQSIFKSQFENIAIQKATSITATPQKFQGFFVSSSELNKHEVSAAAAADAAEPTVLADSQVILEKINGILQQLLSGHQASYEYNSKTQVKNHKDTIEALQDTLCYGSLIKMFNSKTLHESVACTLFLDFSAVRQQDIGSTSNVKRQYKQEVSALIKIEKLITALKPKRFDKLSKVYNFTSSIASSIENESSATQELNPYFDTNLMLLMLNVSSFLRMKNHLNDEYCTHLESSLHLVCAEIETLHKEIIIKGAMTRFNLLKNLKPVYSAIFSCINSYLDLINHAENRDVLRLSFDDVLPTPAEKERQLSEIFLTSCQEYTIFSYDKIKEKTNSYYASNDPKLESQVKTLTFLASRIKALKREHNPEIQHHLRTGKGGIITLSREQKAQMAHQCKSFF